MRGDGCLPATGAIAYRKSTLSAGVASQTVLCTLLLVLIATGTAAQAVSLPPLGFHGAPHCRPRQHPLAAVTLLHRPCSSLIYTLANFHAVLGPTVPFFIKHAPGALRGLNESALVHRLRMRCMLFTELLPRPIRTVEEYSEYMASLAFWNLPAEMVLTFQTDSALCSASRLGVRDFMHFSYVGAPWQHITESPVGNGGLSLRNQTVMRRVIAEVDYFKKRDPEDCYFAETVHKWAKQGVPGVVYPTRAQAARFALETDDLFTSQPGDVLGVHKLFNNRPLHHALLEHVLTRVCPEAIIPLFHSCADGTDNEKVDFVWRAVSHEP